MWFRKKHPIKHRCSKCGQHGICSSHTFHTNIERERERADRSGGVFSLVVFVPPNSDGNGNDKRMLVDMLLGRIRLVDNAGWLSHTEIGVILVDTPHDGARVFTHYLLRDWPKGLRPPEWRIYTYPSRSDPDDGEQRWFGQLDQVDPNSFEANIFRPPPSATATHHQRAGSLKLSRHHADEPQTAEEALNIILAHPPSPAKRLLDIAVSGTMLIVLSPLMLLISLAIRLSSKGPALYHQERVGFMGMTFSCYKFRTMHLNAGTSVHRNYLKYLMMSNAPMTKLDQGGRRDPRIFTVGRLLRASSLDELPQLINVLKGEMSLVGPRPSIPYEYGQFRPWHRHRIQALPGLTGLWQVSGKNKTTFTEMMRFDRTYSNRPSIIMDMKIILRTLPVVIGQLREDLESKSDKKRPGFFDRWRQLVHLQRQEVAGS